MRDNGKKKGISILFSFVLLSALITPLVSSAAASSTTDEASARAVAPSKYALQQQAKPTKTTSKLKWIEGRGVKVCEIYKENIDALPHPNLKCERPVSAKYQGIIKAPDWKPLDLWENRNLLARAGKFLDFGDTDKKISVYDDQKNIDDTASTERAIKGMTMMSASIDIDNDGVDERVLRYQSGICGMSKFYTTSLLILEDTKDVVNAKKSQQLYPFSWRNPNTGRNEPSRPYHYVTSDVFSFADKTYFDRMSFYGSLSVYRTENGQTEEICKFKVQQ